VQTQLDPTELKHYPRNKPADMFKPFRTAKDLSKAFHPLGQDLRHPNNRQHGFTLLFLSHPSYLYRHHRQDAYTAIHPFFPITFQPAMAVSATPDDEKYFHGSGTFI